MRVIVAASLLLRGLPVDTDQPDKGSVSAIRSAALAEREPHNAVSFGETRATQGPSVDPSFGHCSAVRLACIRKFILDQNRWEGSFIAESC